MATTGCRVLKATEKLIFIDRQSFPESHGFSLASLRVFTELEEMQLKAGTLY